MVRTAHSNSGMNGMPKNVRWKWVQNQRSVVRNMCDGNDRAANCSSSAELGTGPCPCRTKEQPKMNFAAQNFIIESHEVIMSSTYQCPTNKLSTVHTMCLPRAYCVQHVTLFPALHIKILVKRIWNVEQVSRQIAACASTRMHNRDQCRSWIIWPQLQIVLRKRGADRLSWRCYRTFEWFSARKIIPTEQSIPASISPHSYGYLSRQIYIKCPDVNNSDSSTQKFYFRNHWPWCVC